MPLLPCTDYYRPILEVLQRHPEGLSGTRLTEEVAALTGLAAEDREEAISDGTPKYVLRIKQARYRLESRKLVTTLPDNLWVITKDGKTLLETTSAPTPYLLPGRKPSDALSVRENAAPAYTPLSIGQDDLVDAPSERIDRALREIQEEVESELILRLHQCSPGFFERAVLKLLEAMGYGEIEHTGGPGDGGIDGILHADRLGLERVFVQAKRLKPNEKVGSPQIQTFCGALSANHATKGVFITTASFSRQAEQQARKAPLALRLIDGKKLSALLCEFGVGVSRARVRVIPEVDRNFFDDA